jgi:hypothetical protein
MIWNMLHLHSILRMSAQVQVHRGKDSPLSCPHFRKSRREMKEKHKRSGSEDEVMMSGLSNLSAHEKSSGFSELGVRI